MARLALQAFLAPLDRPVRLDHQAHVTILGAVREFLNRQVSYEGKLHSAGS